MSLSLTKKAILAGYAHSISLTANTRAAISFALPVITIFIFSLPFCIHCQPYTPIIISNANIVNPFSADFC